MRNNAWLEQKLETLWRSHFSDVERKNNVYILFGRNAQTRLGSIKRNPRLKNSHTRILLTGYFKDERVPEYVIDLTIAHELCHYAHGFSSPLPQLSKYPHQGGLVDKELERRGFGALLGEQKKWLKEEWPKIIGNNFRVKSRKHKAVTTGRQVKSKMSLLDLIFG